MVFQIVCVVYVVPLCVWMPFHMYCLCFVCRKVSPHLRVESWIMGVCSPYVISLCGFEYYVVG